MTEQERSYSKIGVEKYAKKMQAKTGRRFHVFNTVLKQYVNSFHKGKEAFDLISNSDSRLMYLETKRQVQMALF